MRNIEKSQNFYNFEFHFAYICYVHYIIVFGLVTFGELFENMKDERSKMFPGFQKKYGNLDTSPTIMRSERALLFEMRTKPTFKIRNSLRKTSKETVKEKCGCLGKVIKKKTLTLDKEYRSINCRTLQK